jgi:hypothetical protein
MLKIQMTETTYFSLNGHRFENLNIWILNLPFDLAQGGELVEPFRASDLGFRIFAHLLRELVFYSV